MIVQRGRKWVLYTSDGSRILGTHPSHEAAMRQEVAININKKRASVLDITPFILSSLDDLGFEKQAGAISSLVSRLFSRPSSIVRAAETILPRAAPAVERSMMSVLPEAASHFRLPPAAVIDPVELATRLKWKGYSGPRPVFPRMPVSTGPADTLALVDPELREAVRSFRASEAARYGRGAPQPVAQIGQLPTLPVSPSGKPLNQWAGRPFSTGAWAPKEYLESLARRSAEQANRLKWKGINGPRPAFLPAPVPVVGLPTGGIPAAGARLPSQPSLMRAPLPTRAVVPISPSEMGFSMPSLPNLSFA